MYTHTRNSDKKQKVTLQTQNDVSMTYIITSFHCFQQKDNVSQCICVLIFIAQFAIFRVFQEVNGS